MRRNGFGGIKLRGGKIIKAIKGKGSKYLRAREKRRAEKYLREVDKKFLTSKENDVY